MPKLLMLAPCERAIVDQANTVSLITILEEVNVESTQSLPQNPALPLHWTVLSLWESVPGEDEATFQERERLLDPLNQVIAESNIEFRLRMKRQRNVHTFVGSPISGGTGMHSIVSALKPKDRLEWTDVGAFPPSFFDCCYFGFGLDISSGRIAR